MSLSIQFTPEEEALLEAASRQFTRSKSENERLWIIQHEAHIRVLPTR